MLYGTKCLVVENQHENTLSVTKMGMLHWMCGKNKQNKIINDNIWECWGNTYVEKTVENRLKWFGHVERRSVDSVVKRVDQMERSQTNLR